ncbi:MAG: winged helix-turn-helix domain-containing protein [Prevotella sp.]|jgi:phosphoheptose isomerase|nr:winged helix-turn-helix domain-containing protein [Prevotella sp.]MDY6241495.1 winged helix-turn-helix domain-containing protein [Prevotella sp.]
MVERKATKSAAAKATPKKAATKKVATKKAAASKKEAIFVDAVNAGFRAGDVYEALHTAGEAKTVEELVKLTGKSEVEVLLGIGWLLKEGKLKGDGGKVVLA